MRETSRRLESSLVNGVARPIKGREERKEDDNEDEKENENEFEISLC